MYCFWLSGIHAICDPVIRWHIPRACSFNQVCLQLVVIFLYASKHYVYSSYFIAHTVMLRLYASLTSSELFDMYFKCMSVTPVYIELYSETQWWFLTCMYCIPTATNVVGVYWIHLVRLSVLSSVTFSFPHNISSSLYPTFMKLHLCIYIN